MLTTTLFSGGEPLESGRFLYLPKLPGSTWLFRQLQHPVRDPSVPTKLDTTSVEKLVFLKTNIEKIDLARKTFVGENAEEKQARDEAAAEKNRNKPGPSGSRKRPASIDLFTDSD